MIKEYALAIKVGFVALLAGIAAYYRDLVKRRESEIKDIELESAKSQIKAQADAQAADAEALEKGKRRAKRAIKRARSGDRRYFE